MPDMPESYRKLYDAADGIMENISGVGDNFYVYKSGTRGEELYTEILDKYITAVSEKWSPGQFEEGEMSGELGVIAANAEDPFENIGFAYMDINGDGIYALAQAGISAHFYRLLPYLITLIVLAFTSKSSRAPKAEGIPYDKGKR